VRRDTISVGRVYTNDREQLAGKATALFAPSLEAAAHRMTCRDEAWAIACSTQGW